MVKMNDGSGLPICRICYGDHSDGLLGTYCRCIGTVQHMHAECLVQWITLKSLQGLKCEFCNYQFKVQRNWKNVFEWKLPLPTRGDIFVAIVLILFSNFIVLSAAAVGILLLEVAATLWRLFYSIGKITVVLCLVVAAAVLTYYEVGEEITPFWGKFKTMNQKLVAVEIEDTPICRSDVGVQVPSHDDISFTLKLGRACCSRSEAVMRTSAISRTAKVFSSIMSSRSGPY